MPALIKSVKSTTFTVDILDAQKIVDVPAQLSGSFPDIRHSL